MWQFTVNVFSLYWGNLHFTCCCFCWSLLYSTILYSRADLLRSHVILHEWIAFYSAFVWISTDVVYLQRWHGWCHIKRLPSRRVLCTPYNHAPYYFMQSHILEVHAYLAVTCHLHFWQNDRGLLRATAQKIDHGEEISPAGPAGIRIRELFRWRVRRSNHWADPIPGVLCNVAIYSCVMSVMRQFTVHVFSL